MTCCLPKLTDSFFEEPQPVYRPFESTFEECSVAACAIDELLDLNSSSLKVAHLNIRSLLPKIDILSSSFAQAPTYQAKTLFTVSEAWLKNDVPDSAIKLDGYTFFRNNCLTLTNGGGVAAYISSQLKATRRLDIDSTCKDTEVMW